MPLLPKPNYRPPFWMLSAHLETIVPSLFRKVDLAPYKRERIDTEDADFLDLDWLFHERGSNKLVVLSHGLEGNSTRPYMLGMARIFYLAGWDVLAWNCRSCSGEMNRAQRMYHHGVSDDLAIVLDRAGEKQQYDSVCLVGFSMGGSISLKYLGERGYSVPSFVKAAAVFSVPCDLGASARALSSPQNALYRLRFLKKLQKKVRQKAELYPGLIDCKGLEDVAHFPDFDTRYTARLHGFADADDFYTRSSAGAYLAGIRIPTLLVNAENDPMLPPTCFPVEEARNHPYLYLEMPARGGHVGFSQGKGRANWAEERALNFAEQILAEQIQAQE